MKVHAPVSFSTLVALHNMVTTGNLVSSTTLLHLVFSSEKIFFAGPTLNINCNGNLALWGVKLKSDESPEFRVIG